MNGAQLLMAPGNSLGLMSGPPAPKFQFETWGIMVFVFFYLTTNDTVCSINNAEPRCRSRIALRAYRRVVSVAAISVNVDGTDS